MSPRWALPAVLLLAGCASTAMPDLAVPLPGHWRNAPANATRDPRDAGEWWQAFGDPRLDALVGQALAGNLDLQQAEARLRAARILHGRVGSQFKPEVQARTLDAIDPDASAAYFVAGFDATWELGLFGRRTASERMARGAVDAALADAHAARVTLVAEVVRDWIQLRAAQHRAALLGQIRDARAEQFRLAGIRSALALGPTGQLDQARALLAQSEAAIGAPGQDALAAVQALAALLGRAEPDDDWLRPGPLPGVGNWQASALPADLLRTRPDIARAQAAVLRAAGEAGLARAERFPDVGLGGSIRWSTSTAVHQAARTDEAIAGFGPLIDIPLFDWGMRKSRADASASELQAEALAYRQAVLTAVGEVETALGAVEQQRLREAGLARALLAFRGAAETTATRQRLGLASGIESAERRVERDQSALELDEARSTHDLAFIALCKALGGAPVVAMAGTAPDRSAAGAR